VRFVTPQTTSGKFLLGSNADPISGEGALARHKIDVADYYRNTWVDYFAVWTTRDNLALHFGLQEGVCLPHAASLANTNKVLAGLADIKPGDRVLDAGCGLGGSSFWLASNRGAIVAGVALGSDQIQFAKDEAERRKLQHLTSFYVADFEHLPFPSETFDVVWALESLCHSGDKGRFFSEAFRVLRYGGRIIIADFFLRTKVISRSSDAILREWLNGWKIPLLWTAANHANAAKLAGFTNITIKDATGRSVGSHRRLYQLSTLARPLSLLLQQVGIGNKHQHANVLASLRQYQALRANCWFYGILSAQKNCAEERAHECPPRLCRWST
jgi:ubiquinone/menaquinone biosynthesis C-methylase UbiE